VRIDIDFSEVRKLGADIVADAAATRGAIEPAVARSTQWLHGRAVASAPVRTGELRGAITADSSGLARRVYAPVRQSFFQEYGTSFHPPQPFLMVHADAAQGHLEQEIAKAKWGLSAGA
jgi:hypothetical protein